MTVPLCGCGCGRPAPIAKRNYNSVGMRRGDPYRFIRGHNAQGDRSRPIVVDDADAGFLEMQWTLAPSGGANRTRYALRGVVVDGRLKRLRLHRLIAARMMGRELLPGEVVDHLNGDGLDNRRANLRVVPPAENGANRIGLNADNTSGYRGVSWHKRTGKWSAFGRVNGKQFHLGLFDDPAAADAIVRQWRIENQPGYIPENS